MGQGHPFTNFPSNTGGNTAGATTAAYNMGHVNGCVWQKGRTFMYYLLSYWVRSALMYKFSVSTGRASGK